MKQQEINKYKNKIYNELKDKIKASNKEYINIKYNEIGIENELSYKVVRGIINKLIKEKSIEKITIYKNKYCIQTLIKIKEK